MCAELACTLRRLEAKPSWSGQEGRGGQRGVVMILDPMVRQVLLVVLPIIWALSPMIVATTVVGCIVAGILWTTRGHEA
jgi:hypothetical protein